MKNVYSPSLFEQKWIEKWEKEAVYATPALSDSQEKQYILDMFPYPSGSKLHVGHPHGYIATDIIARYMRMKGKAVLHPMGWDAFGLPAENYAIKTGIHPKITTEKAIEDFKQQIRNLGLSYDWSREISTHKSDYYKWTQWFFILLFKRGLAYRKKAPVNYCPSCQTVLANEQVINGRCERCDSEVIQKNMEQWFFRITDYAERLLKDLEKVDWPESTKLGQINWIGKSVGINITYEVVGLDEPVVCFTTRPDTNFGATFIVAAPECDYIQKHLDDFPNKKEIKEYLKQTAKRSERERTMSKTKTGVFTGLYALNNLNNKKLPIYVSDFVLSTVGTGVVVGVPGHDMRDFEFAQAMGIDIVRVVIDANGDISPISKTEQVQEEEGVMVNSEFLNGLGIAQAKNKIMDYLEQKGWGKRVVNYRLRDWLVSRQRYWGAPIPMVYCKQCQWQSVPDKDLPVLLPQDVDFKPTGKSPLAYSASFQKNAFCPVCGNSAVREVDTMDTFVDSSWYFLRFTDPHNDQEFASKKNISNWMPVDCYVGGAEHTVLHLLYARFLTKVLYDEGILQIDEPFQKLRHQGTILAADGRKMSKRWGNVINPDSEIERFGADTVRIYEMFMGPFKDTKLWTTQGTQGVYRFLSKVWALQFKVKMAPPDIAQRQEVQKLIHNVTLGIESLHFNTTVSKFMEFVNFLSKKENIDIYVWEKFILLLAPFAPFTTEQLWHNIKKLFSVHTQSWPLDFSKASEEQKSVIAVQFNGKTRGTIEADNTSSKDAIVKLVKSMSQFKKHIITEPKSVIFVRGRVINFVF